MFIMGLISWWYGPGWRGRAVRLREKLASSADYFSVDLLLRTFFSPFRQISAGRVNGPLNMQMRAFFDRLISRAIGAMVRSVMIIVGLLAMTLHTVIGAVLLVAWGIVPLLPVIGIILAITGWIPWSL